MPWFCCTKNQAFSASNSPKSAPSAVGLVSIHPGSPRGSGQDPRPASQNPDPDASHPGLKSNPKSNLRVELGNGTRATPSLESAGHLSENTFPPFPLGQVGQSRPPSLSTPCQGRMDQAAEEVERVGKDLETNSVSTSKSELDPDGELKGFWDDIFS